jgi:hypothetical protein
MQGIHYNICKRGQQTRQLSSRLVSQCDGKVLLPTYLLNSTEQSPSCEANRFSASQEIPCIFMEPEGSLLHSQVPATCPYHEPDRSSACLPIPLSEDPS